MKKIYFLISIFIFGLTSGLAVNSSSSKNNHNFTADNINIASDKYLSLAYSNGQFFSWNQSNITSEHVTGIFTSSDNKSYLLTDTGVFINLNYQIINFTKINDTLGIAQLSSYTDSSGLLWTDKDFIVAIDNNNNFIVKYDAPIKTQNYDFVALDDNTFFAYGIGLDLITISGSNITVVSKVDAYEGGYLPTSIYLLDTATAIFINGDGQLYYLTDILGTFTKTPLSWYPLTGYNNVIGIIDSKHFVFRDFSSNVKYFDLTLMNVTDLKFKSVANNFFFKLNNNEFIINSSHQNASNDFGFPYLINVNDLLNPIAIDTKDTSTNIIVNSTNQGIFIDGSSVAYRFQLINDKFTFTTLGNIDSYQYINQNLGFASFKGTNLLISANSNNSWLLQKSIDISVTGTNSVNHLNNTLITNKGIINRKNSYFSNGYLNLKINNNNLVNATVASSQGSTTLNPVDNVISYTFNSFIKYQVTINFIFNSNPYVFNYQVNIDSFKENKLFNIFGLNITNYVGYNNNNQLYDIQAINEHSDFTVTAFNYDLLQSVQLIRFDTNLVIRSITNIREDYTIGPTLIDKYALKEYLCALKVENLLNQTKMIYIGFIQDDGRKPMVAFWDTEKGKELRKEALLRNFTDKQLDDMNAFSINNLIQEATAWNLIKVQATTLAYIIIGAITISSIAALVSFSYNLYLTRKIRLNPKFKNEVIIDAK